MRAYLMCCAALALAGGATAQSSSPAAGASGTPVVPQRLASIASVKPGPMGSLPSRADSVPPPAPAAESDQPDPGSNVAIARRVVDAAGAFDGYMRRTAKISANFTSGESVARAVELGSVYEPRQLEEGAIAYAALVAMQDPAFVEAVHAVGENSSARDALVGRLVEHPEDCLDVSAAHRTAARVSRLLAKMGMNMVVAGAAIKQASYDLQSQPWSKLAILTPQQRLARIETESSSPISLAPPDTAQLIDGLVALRSDAGSQEEATFVTPVVTRGLALAALAILGMAGDDQEQRIAPLLTDATDAECIKMARLNDLQCLAVVGPQYEDVFCLGSFAMMDSGRCIASAAGMSERELQPLIDRRSVFVPIASTPDQGTERNPLQERSRAAGVAVPMAAVVTPASYSPYSGPGQP